MSKDSKEMLKKWADRQASIKSNGQADSITPKQKLNYIGLADVNQDTNVIYASYKAGTSFIKNTVSGLNDGKLESHQIFITEQNKKKPYPEIDKLYDKVKEIKDKVHDSRTREEANTFLNKLTEIIAKRDAMLMSIEVKTERGRAYWNEISANTANINFAREAANLIYEHKRIMLAGPNKINMIAYYAHVAYRETSKVISEIGKALNIIKKETDSQQAAPNEQASANADFKTRYIYARTELAKGQNDIRKELEEAEQAVQGPRPGGSSSAT